MIGRIYKIYYKNILYIGSTINSISERWCNHVRSYFRYLYLNRGCSIYYYFKKYGLRKFEIELVKEYEIFDVKELLAYEQLHINRNRNCININNPFDIISKIKRNKSKFFNNKKRKLDDEDEYIPNKIYKKSIWV